MSPHWRNSSYVKCTPGGVPSNTMNAIEFDLCPLWRRPADEHESFVHTGHPEVVRTPVRGTALSTPRRTLRHSKAIMQIKILSALIRYARAHFLFIQSPLRPTFPFLSYMLELPGPFHRSYGGQLSCSVAHARARTHTHTHTHTCGGVPGEFYILRSAGVPSVDYVVRDHLLI
jgi:hypothetical protein